MQRNELVPVEVGCSVCWRYWASC